MKARAFLVAKKPQRARRKRVDANQLANAAGGHALFPRLNVKAQTAALRLTGVHRQVRVAQHKTANDVGAARNRLQRQLFDLIADPVKLRVVQHRARGQHGAQRAQVKLAPRCQTRVFAHAQIGWTGAKHRDTLVSDQTPKPVHAGNRPVVSHDFDAAGQRRQLPVPHHPGAAGVEIHTLAGPQVGVEPVLFQMLQQCAARAVDDALGLARGARRKHDEQRVIESKTPPHKTLGVAAVDQRIERVNRQLWRAGQATAVQADDALQRRQCGGQRGDVVG